MLVEESKAINAAQEPVNEAPSPVGTCLVPLQQYLPQPLPTPPMPEPCKVPAPNWTMDTGLVNLDSMPTPSGDNVDTPSSMPQLEVRENEWQHFWPELTSVLKQFLHPPTPDAEQPDSMPGALPVLGEVTHAEPEDSSEEVTPVTAVESPLAGEALLSRPANLEGQEMKERPAVYTRRLSDYLTVSSPPSATPVLPYGLQVACVRVNNIPDGQVFPPGAEFVKSWHMRNSGQVSWPEETALVFVAGERLPPSDSASTRVHIGMVAPGEEVEMACGEMKAPDAPGKYVSYWRLHDGRRYFGDSVWVDIVVVEVNDDTSDESLAASSIIIPSAPSAPSGDAGTRTVSVESSLPASVTAPSGALSDDGSFDSSISLIDVPSSPSANDDDDLYQDSRTHITSPVGRSNEVEYVVLYDTSSSEEE